MNCFIHGSFIEEGSCPVCAAKEASRTTSKVRKLYSKLDTTKYETRQEYTQVCAGCGQVHNLRAQVDNDPEYYTDIFLECYECGEAVHFCLPVN